MLANSNSIVTPAAARDSAENPGAKEIIMDEFVKFISEIWEDESEYAGRMETWCYYCGKYQEPRQPESHENDCLHVKALAIVLAAEQINACVCSEKDGGDPGKLGYPPYHGSQIHGGCTCVAVRDTSDLACNHPHVYATNKGAFCTKCKTTIKTPSA